jgi:phage tail-like protein
MQPALTRHNPLRTYQFRVGFDAEPDYFAAVQRLSGLSVSIEATEIREGGNSAHRIAHPDRATWEPLTLEQGLAVDERLERWAGACLDHLEGRRPAAAVKRTVVIDVWDPQQHGGSDASAAAQGPAGGPGQRAHRLRRYRVFNAWVSRLQALPQLDAMRDEVGLLVVELTHEGWRRDPQGPADLYGSGAEPLTA